MGDVEKAEKRQLHKKTKRKAVKRQKERRENVTYLSPIVVSFLVVVLELMSFVR